MPNSQLPPYTSMKIVGDDGTPTSEFDLYMDQKHQYVEKNLGPSGYVLPAVTNKQFNTVQEDAAEGTIWHRTEVVAEDQRLVVKIGENFYYINLTLIP